MWHFIKSLLKFFTGCMVIIALDVILKKVDSSIGNEWIFMTLVIYNGYCYLEYRLTDKEK